MQRRMGLYIIYLYRHRDFCLFAAERKHHYPSTPTTPETPPTSATPEVTDGPLFQSLEGETVQQMMGRINVSTVYYSKRDTSGFPLFLLFFCAIIVIRGDACARAKAQYQRQCIHISFQPTGVYSLTVLGTASGRRGYHQLRHQAGYPGECYYRWAV